MVDGPIHLMPVPRRLTRLPGTYRGPATPRPIPPAFPPQPQRYQLTISPGGITAAAGDPAAAAYAGRTLAQLVAQFGHDLPCLTIDDWPDYPVRGAMLDVSRDKVPTMATLYALVDRLAAWKVNQLQLYTEHTFAYSAHRDVWADASPITAEEVRHLDAYCRAQQVELVPNQNSFGHMERWLKHPAYAHLAEAPGGADTPWGFRWNGPFSLCPTDPASIQLLAGLYAELLPNFTSGLFNVGCDETFDIGLGRSATAVAGRGVTTVYLDYLRQVDAVVRSHGRRTLFWGDVILHHPDRIADLPAGITALNWGYEADHPFDAEGGAFAAAGVPFYVCPGTSGWNSIAGRTGNCLANLANAAAAGRRHGAVGYLVTDWGDNGHLQPLPVSHLGLMAGAALGWCGESNGSVDWPAALDRFALPGLGRAAYDLGNVYRAVPKRDRNGSTLFRLLVPSPAEPHPERGVTADDLDAAEAAIPAVTGTAPEADELRHAAAMLRLCCAAGRRRLGLATDLDPAPIVAEHRRLWLARNRPGGLDDSCRRLRLPDR